MYVCLYSVVTLLLVPLLRLCRHNSVAWIPALAVAGGTLLHTEWQNDISLLYGCLAVLVYYTYRTAMSGLVQWVFFHDKETEYRRNIYPTSLAADYIIIWAMLTVHLHYAKPTEWTLYTVTLCIVLNRIWLYMKTYAVFFGEILSCLHFFAYLCTLEMIPMLVFARTFDIAA